MRGYELAGNLPSSGSKIEPFLNAIQCPNFFPACLTSITDSRSSILESGSPRPMEVFFHGRQVSSESMEVSSCTDRHLSSHGALSAARAALYGTPATIAATAMPQSKSFFCFISRNFRSFSNLLSRSRGGNRERKLIGEKK